MSNPKFYPYKRQLGIKIAYYRKIKNLSQLELAEKANISRTHLSNIEAPNMATGISLDTLFAIAEALGVSVNKLLEFED